MNKTERIIHEQESRSILYQVTYYEDENEKQGKMFEDFEDVIYFVEKLYNFKHIDILRFDKSEL